MTSFGQAKDADIDAIMKLSEVNREMCEENVKILLYNSTI